MSTALLNVCQGTCCDGFALPGWQSLVDFHAANPTNLEWQDRNAGWCGTGSTVRSFART